MDVGNTDVTTTEVETLWTSEGSPQGGDTGSLTGSVPGEDDPKVRSKG